MAEREQCNIRVHRYCAELVAACLKAGGLMSGDSNAGEATPHSLFSMYKRQGAVMANPCTLRQQFGATRAITLGTGTGGTASSSVAPLLSSVVTGCVGALPLATMPLTLVPTAATRAPTGVSTHTASRCCSGGGTRRVRADSPPHMQFRVLQQRGLEDHRVLNTIRLSMSSLNTTRTP